MSDIPATFAPDGPLARAIAGFSPRTQQTEMAERVAQAIADRSVLVVEAGTGTGKTYAYLVPALMSGAKVIVSTGTKTLQDQLYGRDLPTVRGALGVPVSIALLKGRANYLCHYHLERALHEGRLGSREEASHLQAIARWAKVTSTGDKAQCSEVPEESGAWSLATSTRDNCLGQDCPNAKECFVTAARREAMEADVVVVNHHLFFADLMLRDEGVAELLPACNAVVFDEAHQLAETASLFFGESVSTSQMMELARDTRAEAVVNAKDFKALPESAERLVKAVRDLRLVFREENVRLSAAQIDERPAFAPALATVMEALNELAGLLETQAARSEGLEKCWQRALDLIVRVERWQTGDRPGEKTDRVRWAEIYTQALALNATPLSVADIFRRQMEDNPRAWIFTSATLSVGNDFGHYCGELGLYDAQTAQWGSPFAYEQQALLYAPENMPEPSSPNYAEAVAKAAWPLIRACRGGVFVLCTSLRAMKRIHELIEDRLSAYDPERPLLIQGQATRSELLDRHRAAGNAVLVASQSFWEGVDVRGDALQLVIIDKLPFAPPDDPVLSARIEHLKKQGRNAFSEYQLPHAVISMKQGAGRLIRDERDHGVLMVCDPRLVDKPYGKVIWRSLPPMRRTRSADVAVQFLETLGG
ncbi:Putative ATP-dependent helicase [Methyloversatilis universalis FAM5]|uniref:DNA 5'-3' helicase n=1 Tax=Methyloversatilis universalis (strain ATCC BAA-1314 / DSM 25237 / JCM 13912 / CCUG 52030 / FAM5) TaxID=1000565 RepID=F5R8F6_METUF|nr:ATP-dependent DNA helicase [Methyloversatilis universalis]EGK73259.1 Putative ATP-dependent helicase [Methyloversatilis universalis FAM5]